MSAADLLDDQPARDIPGGADQDDVAGLVQRIDAVTPAVLEAAVPAAGPVRGEDTGGVEAAQERGCGGGTGM